MPLPEASLREGSAIEAIHEAAQVLASGHLVAFPTETVYGLGADGLNPEAVQKIFNAKGRPADHPVILHVADIAHARQLVAQWPQTAEELAQTFWPGPLTLILKRGAHVSDMVTGGQDTVGIRIPSHPVARELLKVFSQVGSGVIAAPSANRFGAVSPTRAHDVELGLGAYLGPTDMILDGGSCDVGVESTIVDLSSGTPRVLRPGGVSRESISRALGQALSNVGEGQVPRVSGSLASHYAPAARTQLCDRATLTQLAQNMLQHSPTLKIAAMCLGSGDALDPRITVCHMPPEPQAYAKILYATLNDLDQQGHEVLLIERPPQSAEWEAVTDRLTRACA